jgi:hypothetical protein
MPTAAGNLSFTTPRTPRQRRPSVTLNDGNRARAGALSATLDHRECGGSQRRLGGRAASIAVTEDGRINAAITRWPTSRPAPAGRDGHVSSGSLSDPSCAGVTDDTERALRAG